MSIKFSQFYFTKKESRTKLKMADLVRTADKKFNFSKDDTTNLAFKLYTITELFKETLQSYHINRLLQGYKEALLK